MKWENFWFYLLALFMIYHAFNLGDVYGMQPFARYPFSDELIDPQVDNLDAVANSTGIDNFPNDIISGTYLSDGNYLNATLWLSNPISTARHGDYFNSNLSYRMYVYDVDLEDRTTRHLLYSIEIYPEEDGSWTKRIIEYEPWIESVAETEYAASKTPKIYPNYKGLFQDNNTYVNMDLELRDIGYPTDIGIQFRTFVEKEGDLIEDRTHTFDAPSRRNQRILEGPTTLEARLGETVTGKLLIHNFELAAPGNITLQDTKTDNYTLQFEPKTIEYPLNGTISSEFMITVSPSIIDSGILLPIEANANITTIENVNVSQTETFYVTILPPLPELDRFVRSFSEFLLDTFAIYWIPFSISLVFGFLLSRRIDKRLEEKEQQQSSQDTLLQKLRPEDILTVNASVVAGVLIFLTVGGTELFGSQRIMHISILTASIVFPFAISAIRTLVTGDYVAGIKFMIFGFIFLMVAVVLIAIVLGNQYLLNI
jgi:hypothetical protein